MPSYEYWLIKDYTGGDEVVRLVTTPELLEELERCRLDETHKIAVYEVGKCVLDWS